MEGIRLGVKGVVCMWGGALTVLESWCKACDSWRLDQLEHSASGRFDGPSSTKSPGVSLAELVSYAAGTPC